MCSLEVYVSDGRFHLDLYMSSLWSHIVLNYIGPDDGQGIQLYDDGTTSAMHYIDNTKEAGSYSPGDGNVVLGRYYTDFYDDSDPYTGVKIDELLFFNTKLDSTEVAALANYV